MLPLPLLYVIFVLSGAAGLIYESIWTRYLGLFVGHSAYAQVIVLVIFLGGMSIGAWLVGRTTERIARPLFWYAIVEIVAGLIGLVFHDIYGAVTGVVYDVVFPALGMGLVQTVVKWSVAALLILPQSILLGATFPLMSAGVVRRMPGGAGRGLSLLYFSNSLGAAAGVLLAGFVLVRLAGLPGTLLTAAMLNMVVGLVVLIASRLEAPVAGEDAVPAPDYTAPTPPEGGMVLPGLWRLMLAVSFGTALSSFIYEIAWIRMLSLVLGSATHSFELMLSAFILGLALGAWWIRGRVDRAATSLVPLAVIQLAMGALAIATLPVYLASFDWMAGFLATFARTDQGYLGFSISRYVICLAVMLPATFCAGMTLPLITRILVSTPTGERAIGQVYSINTLGSIIGVSLAALALMPLLGLKGLLITGALVDVALGITLLLAERRRAGRPATIGRRGILVAGLAAASLLVLVVVSRFDPTLLTSGVFRYGTVQRPGTREVLFYKDGRTATVSVRRLSGTGGLTLATNGKPDASLGPEWTDTTRTWGAGPLTHDAPTQLFIALVAMAHAPSARSAVVIGHGSGMTSHTLLGSPALERIVTIEIEPEMLRASQLFRPANRRAFDDPRSQFVVDDARAYFAAQQQPVDLIISEPSNPWVSGVSGLFTVEFYERVARHLAPDGVFAQWLHLYEIDDALVLSVVAAINRHFPAYQIYSMSNRDILIVATRAAALPEPTWAVLEHPAIRDDLSRAWPITAATMNAMHVADHRTFAPLLALAGQPNSDYYPVLDLGAERTRYLRSEASGFAGLNMGLVNLPAIIGDRRLGLGDPYAVVPGVPRLGSMAIAAAMRTPDARAGPLAIAASERRRSFLASLAGGAPLDWRSWAGSMAEVTAIIHGGMAGVADTAFFQAVDAHLARHAAPSEARAVGDFLRGITGWDFATVSRAGDTLLASAGRGDHWIDADVLADGLVLARLRLGDAAGAREAYRVLAPWSRRSSTDFRAQLLLSYLTPAAQKPTSP